MKLFYKTLIIFFFTGESALYAQTGTPGPNLLGAKGTFSAPYVTPFQYGSYKDKNRCTSNGENSYSPKDNVGNALSTLSGAGIGIPASGYTYTSNKGGLQPEYTYTLIKNIGDQDGRNCIKGDWRGKDHTGDGGWFMAINGAPSSSSQYSKIFYSITSIPVCPGSQYEFSAYLKTLLPESSQYATDGSEPIVSFRIIAGADTTVVVQPTKILYKADNDFTWDKVKGTYTAPAGVTKVDLQVINATTVAEGNDFGLDDISFNLVNSNITISAPGNIFCDISSGEITFTVNDVTHTNNWYKWQVSHDGGITYKDTTINGVSSGKATFTGDSYSLLLILQNVTSDMMNTKYRLVASTSKDGLKNPNCNFFNDYTLIVGPCGILPITLTRFNGRYDNGISVLNWQSDQEINSSRYEVYRSDDGQQFSYIGSVDAAEFSNGFRNYSFTDYHPGNGQFVYYRLKLVGKDGKFTYSNVVKVTKGNKSDIEVYPNPFGNYFTVSFNATRTSNATLIIRNTIGQPLMKKTIRAVQGSNSINIADLPSLAPGIYYVTVSNDDLNYNIKMQKQ